MRKIDKDFDDIPTMLATCAEKRKSKGYIDEKNGKFSSACYKQARKKLRQIYHTKCVYCESKLLKTDFDTVEHYRPKIEYFWLAYEWSNLMLACNICNNSKQDEFKLLSTKFDGWKYSIAKLPFKITDLKLMSEKPLMINPEIEDPENFLKYESNGELSAKQTDTERKNRAEYTITVCKINRDDLKFERKRIIDEVFNNLRLQIKELKKTIIENKQSVESLLSLSFNTILKRLKDNAENPKIEYTLIHRTIYNNFESLFVDKLQREQDKKILKKAIDLFKNAVLKQI